MRVKVKHWASRCEQVKIRLREPIWWFPYPLIISFALVMLLTAHSLFGTNPRVGNPADIIVFPSETMADSPLWMSVTPIGDEIVVTTGKRDVFRWPQDVKDLEALQPFIAHLKVRAAEEVEAAVLAQKVETSQTTAVIAADQRLKYLHIRPIIHALALAGISRYAFETKNPVMASQDDHGSPAAHGGEHREH